MKYTILFSLCFILSAAATFAEDSESDFLSSFSTAALPENKTAAVSPYGASRVAEMLSFGAVGETKKALDAAFLTKERSSWYTLPKGNDLPFTEFNALFLQKGFAVESNYVKVLESIFRIELAPTDFNSPGAADTVNAWVDNATNHQIQKLFSKFSPQTRLVLVNTLNFKGQWVVPFDKTKTKPGKFYPPAQPQAEPVEIPFMENTANFLYHKQDELQALSLPFDKGNTLLLILPSGKGFDFAMPTEKIIGGIQKLLTPHHVHVKLPLVNIESETDLKPVLTNIGTGIIFDSAKADFKNISSSKDLYVGEMLQKVKVSFDETGVTAASASGASLVMKSAAPEKINNAEFIADKPFLFVIQNTASGIPLFIGLYNGQ
jgi:serpin B